MRTCTTCYVEKDFTCFNKQPGGKYGIKSMCRDCQKQDSANRYHNGGGKEYQKYKHIYDTYGLSKEQYLEMIVDGCQICRTDIDLVVDHCHDTGVVRGILCRQCNAGIGQLRDNAELVLRAYFYLGGSDVA